MSLGFGVVSPFGAKRGDCDGPLPERLAYVEDWPRRMRAIFGAETVLDSTRGKILHRTDEFPAWVFPLDDVRSELLRQNTASTWDLVVGERSAPSAVRAAPHLAGPAGDAVAGMIELEYSAVDRWFEEDDPVYGHPRDPYHRVDVLSSSRHVTVYCDGELVAASGRPKLLFETGVPIRYYVPFSDVRIHLLEHSDTVSECPYKGDGQHWHLITDSRTVEDAAWSLPHPLPEAFAAAEHVCFYPDRVQVVVDGHPVVQ